MNVEAQKRAAAARAVDFVRSGMRLGLGTGSTAQHFVDFLAERFANESLWPSLEQIKALAVR